MKLSAARFTYAIYCQWYTVYTPVRWIAHVHSAITLQANNDIYVCIVVDKLISLLQDFLYKVKENDDYHAYQLLSHFLHAWLDDRTCGLQVTQSTTDNLNDHQSWFSKWTRCSFTGVPVLIPFRLSKNDSLDSYVFDGFSTLIKVKNNELAGYRRMQFIANNLDQIYYDWNLWNSNTRPLFVEGKQYLRYCAWIHRIDIQRFLTFLQYGFHILEEQQAVDTDEQRCVTYPWNWACRISQQPLSSLYLDLRIHLIAKQLGYSIECEQERKAIMCAMGIEYNEQ